MSRVRATPDAYLGLDDPPAEAWDAWYRAMQSERDAELARAGLDPHSGVAAVPGVAAVSGVSRVYRDPSTDWSDTTFRQVFLFMYDTSFYDRHAARYRTRELVDTWRAMFGRVDSVLLWHAYPRLGFDSRNQFDFYRDMPGGLAKLRADVVDVCHAHGLRVFIDYNPWADGSYDELGEILCDLDADGVMLDTLPSAPESLEGAVNQRKRGVVFVPELRPHVADLGRFRQAWAQWSDIGDAQTPSIFRHRWLVPQHRQLVIRRWDESRKRDIVYSFFNGSGLLLWDNVFGTWNPYSREDRRLIAETAAILDHHQELLVHGNWRPLIPTGVSGLDANRWDLGARAIVILRNRTDAPLAYRIPDDAPANFSYLAFWGDRHALRGGDVVTVEPGSVQTVVLDDPSEAQRALAHFQLLSRHADVDLPGYDERRPRPHHVHASARRRAPVAASVAKMTKMIEIPAGDFQMKIRHPRRECGCYPSGATDAAMWGWFHQDTIEHVVAVSSKRFAMRATAVTNADFLAFVHATHYWPDDDENFLKHIARQAKDASLPETLADAQGLLPVTFVSLADARAYASWCGQRLPTEAEWQWAAEGAGRGNKYPWGNASRSFPNHLQTALDPSTATPQGIMGLSGNAWELTESEMTDGHTRFVMLRGGVFLPRVTSRPPQSGGPPGESEWLIPRGARPNDDHAKYILLSDGLDRSETVSFRTAADLK
ncbi:MAG TPA: SUMF1/EgtB/PvdO family nonheme iron enzyme [Polyangiaceae bacterium]|nr:SUMF1/EgtB/PvdO family nonheme iron enzyme [Polyangiaceae bacterium]